MSWGIAETASVIEKIQSESADYLNGLNACGVIDWNTYNYAFDFYADLLMEAYEQGRKDAQPELLTDKEQRIFLAAMGREEKVCKQVDDECRDCREPYEDSLVRVCHEIIRKVKATLWET